MVYEAETVSTPTWIVDKLDKTSSPVYRIHVVYTTLGRQTWRLQILTADSITHLVEKLTSLDATIRRKSLLKGHCLYTDCTRN